MPSNFTENYQLSQWSKDDRIQMEDFNADNAKIDAALAGKGNCQIITGSYVGTGVCGKGHPTVVTFPQKPLLVFIYYSGQPTIAIYGASSCIQISASLTPRSLHSTWTGNTLSFYDGSSSTSTSNQSNSEGMTYRYIAFVEA